VATNATGTFVKGIASNNGNLYVMLNSKLQQVDLTLGTYTDKGALPNDNLVYPVTYGKYTILLSGGVPYVYDGTTLSAVTTYVSGSKPRFGVTFANFTWMAGGDTYSNILYISRPTTAANPEYCYDFTGSGADSLILKSNIEALAVTLDRIFIFQEDRIEWLSRSSYVTIAGSLKWTPNPFATGEQIASPTSPIVVGDKVLYLTKAKKIKAINYAVGVDQVEISNISDDPVTGINDFMDSLDDDQSQAYGFYDSVAKQAKWYVKSRGSTVNDLVLIYDLVAKTFLVDNNKFFSCVTTHDSKIYAGSMLNGNVYEDETGYDDDGAEIAWYRVSAPFSYGTHSKNKIWKHFEQTGTINTLTTIQQDILVDGNVVDTSTISKDAPIQGAGIGANPIGQVPIAGNPQPVTIKNYTKARGLGFMNAIGKFIQVKHSGVGVGQYMTLETALIDGDITNYLEPEDQ